VVDEYLMGRNSGEKLKKKGLGKQKSKEGAMVWCSKEEEDEEDERGCLLPLEKRKTSSSP
jgi:hypothetical protein